MTTCKICKTDAIDNDVICNVCKFPLRGTEQEQASFIAKQIIQKSEVEQSIERLKKSRTILFILGAFYLIAPFTPLMKTTSTFAIVISTILALVFIGFGFLTFRKPKIAFLIPLSITILYYVILLLINPMLLFSGLLWKMIIIIGLGYGYISARKSDQILKENQYLASELGFKTRSNN